MVEEIIAKLAIPLVICIFFIIVSISDEAFGIKPNDKGRNLLRWLAVGIFIFYTMSTFINPNASIASDPYEGINEPSRIFDRANSFYSSNNYSKAALGYEKVIVRDSEDFFAWYMYGASQYFINKKNESLDAFDSSISRIPVENLSSFLYPTYFKGDIFLEKGSYKKAQQVYEYILSVSPKDSHANGNLGFIHYKLNNIKKSIDYYYKANQSAPELTTFRNALLYFKDKGKSIPGKILDAPNDPIPLSIQPETPPGKAKPKYSLRVINLRAWEVIQELKKARKDLAEHSNDVSNEKNTVLSNSSSDNAQASLPESLDKQKSESIEWPMVFSTSRRGITFLDANQVCLEPKTSLELPYSATSEYAKNRRKQVLTIGLARMNSGDDCHKGTFREYSSIIDSKEGWDCSGSIELIKEASRVSFRWVTLDGQGKGDEAKCPAETKYELIERRRL
ncbi:tetratricopeptide repeat protein [Leptothoe spongobia]|uniref:Tetratricopeptide repeat protein n=1 Tax=Leptothoe spongobia TAU-MAC 1115 TaxID=1967444 RepID=A0A947GJ08_9CYAN|nr:tetratricopeptide repeat protein [Leptothoe spongobia]MBT9315312.1 tetratricopeptide repeat protein [Leptothoe spongobia TAU-MAC 1115]